jgi:COP9 signalosome complex subunit 3
MLRLDPSTETLTSTHRMFAHLCLLSKSYSAALPILDNDIYQFPSVTNLAFQNMLPPPCANHEFSSGYITATSGHSKKLNHRTPLEYYMYAAMIYMCLKNWERALFFLEACITMPTQNVASAIQVEAYRKYLLVGLIHTGAVRFGIRPQTTITTNNLCSQSLCRETRISKPPEI